MSNMLALATELGCQGKADTKCLCTTPNFSNGIRDCANEACQNATASSIVIKFGIDYCVCECFSTRVSYG